MTAEIWGALGLALLGAGAWLIRFIRRADRDKQVLKDARDYQKTMERMTGAPRAADPDDARNRLRSRDPNLR